MAQAGSSDARRAFAGQRWKRETDVRDFLVGNVEPGCNAR